jgi:MFS transporter, MHS family, shikimate and dehydroshikimate transport protein
MEKPGGKNNAKQVSIRQIAFASSIGTAIEYYDFFLYGTAAATVFPKLFFPKFSSVGGTLASFATFGVAYLARPVGGVVFGHFGDRVGRKSMLMITLVLMGGATFLIGLLPTFEQVGVLAPILLAVLRFLQGFALGGEWGGATLMAVEHAPDKGRNFYASWPQIGTPAGGILSTVAFAAFSSLPDTQFFTWGWRVPFLLSIILIGVGLFIRLRVPESPVFSRVKERGAESKLPLIEVLRCYPVAAILAIGVALVHIGGFNIVITFTLSYITVQLGVARNVGVIGFMVANAAGILSILTFARVADRVGKRRVAIWSAGCTFLLSYPFFWLIDTRNPVLIGLAMSVWIFAVDGVWSIMGVFIAELFPARVRYSGVSLGYNMVGILGGAPAPMIATALIGWTGGASWPVATYLAANSFISLVAVYLASEKYRVEIHDQPSVGRRLAASADEK